MAGALSQQCFGGGRFFRCDDIVGMTALRLDLCALLDNIKHPLCQRFVIGFADQVGVVRERNNLICHAISRLIPLATDDDALAHTTCIRHQFGIVPPDKGLIVGLASHQSGAPAFEPGALFADTADMMQIRQMLQDLYAFGVTKEIDLCGRVKGCKMPQRRCGQQRIANSRHMNGENALWRRLKRRHTRSANRRSWLSVASRISSCRICSANAGRRRYSITSASVR